MICRPILLHNEFMPAIYGERDWHYQVLGYHDGMTIEDGFEIQNVNSFKEMFNKCVEYEDKEMHPYFTQFLFGFHPDKKKDEEFWSSEYNFTYLSLLQVNNKKIQEQREYLEKLCFLGAEVIAYYSLDNSDLIFAVKCNSCKQGFQIINDLHTKINSESETSFELRNSYTVLALRKQDINNISKFDGLDEKIDVLELRIVEKNYNSTCNLYNKLKAELCRNINTTSVTRMGILGTEDEAIIIKELYWKDLIPLYQDGETGILCNSNEAIENYANAVSAKIMFPIEENTKFINVNKKNDDPINLLCSLIYCNIKEIYKNKEDGISNAEKKNLMMLADALWRFEYAYNERKIFSDYNFFPILEPLFMFTELAKETNDMLSYFYYSFMEEMKLCTQNFTKPDRVYSQRTDFNMRYFDVPAKLVIFYSAYMFYLKRVLNKTSNLERICKYEFLVCPGVNNKTEVKELFARGLPKEDKGESSENRLFLVEIPEQQIYSPKEMLIVLGHETAHFVGRTIRKREKRFDYIIKSCIRAITISLKHYVLYSENWDEKHIDNCNWEYLEGKLEEWIKYSVNQYMDEDYLKQRYHNSEEGGDDREIADGIIGRNQKFYKKYYYHTDILKKLLVSSVEELLINRGKEILGFITWSNMDDEPDNYERYNMIVKKAIYAFTDSHGRYTELTLEKVIDNIIFLFKECYADMICILTLNLSMNDYLSSFVEVFKTGNYDLEYITNSILLPRIAIVMQAMHYDIGSYNEETVEEEFSWDNNELNKLEKEEVIEIEIEAQKFWKNIQKDPAYYTGEVTEGMLLAHGVNIVYDPIVAKKVLEYLLYCRKDFNKEIISKKFEDEKNLDNVRKFYKAVTTGDINSFFPDMMDLLKVYEEDVYQNVKRILDELKGNSHSGEQKK